MTLFNFAYNNIRRDFKTYLYHFLSCVFSVFIFFLFSSLATHPALQIVDKGSTIGIILFMASIVSMMFSFVLILYSVGNFLKNRSKQFAILNIIGASKKQFKRLIFLENIIISLLALLVGIISGFVFLKFFLMIAQAMIDGLDLYFYLPLIPMILTILLMGGLFLAVSLLAPVILRRKRVIELLKKEEIAEKNHFLLSTIALIVIFGPTLYFHIKRNFFIFIYVLDLLSYVSIAYFVFSLIFTLYQLFMEKSGRMYSKNNLIKLSNFKYKIHTNIKTMTGAMILFSIVLTSFVYIVGAPLNIEEDTQKIMPYAYMYDNWEDEAAGEKKADILSKELADIQGAKTLSISFAKFKSKERPIRHIILSNSMYNEVAEFLGRDKVNLADDEYFLVGVSGKTEPVLKDMVREKLNEYAIKVQKGEEKRIIAVSGYFTSVTVVSDSKYQVISKDLVKDAIYAFTQDDFKTGGSQKFEELKKAIGFEMGKESLISYFDYYDSENLTRKLVSYVGSILCISFLIGIASIIYSRLYSSIEEESRKYSIMMKIGLSREELKDVLSSTLRWVLVLPFTVALGISWMIVIFIEQNTVASYSGLAVICSCIYLAVEFIMYIMIKKRYQKKIFDNIYEI